MSEFRPTPREGAGRPRPTPEVGRRAYLRHGRSDAGKDDVPRRRWALDAVSALDQLQPLERHVLLLSYGRGRPQAEIAAQLGLSDRVVRTLAAQALQRLAGVLAGEHPADPTGNW